MVGKCMWVLVKADKAICEKLRTEIDAHLPEAAGKIWHVEGRTVWGTLFYEEMPQLGEFYEKAH